jgi:hypothetical protein
VGSQLAGRSGRFPLNGSKGRLTWAGECTIHQKVTAVRLSFDLVVEEAKVHNKPVVSGR